jgi:hypothetical protein
MGIPDGAHTHGSGGGGLGTTVLVIVAAALAVKYAAPVAAAAISLVNVVLIAVAVVAGIGVITAAGVLVYRRRHPRELPPVQVQATVLPKPHPLPPARQAIEQHVHHHWHGVTAEQVAAILRQQEAHDE